MANQDIHEPLDFSEELRTLEPSDLGHADTFNPLFKRLINNDAFLKAMQDALAEEIGVVDQRVTSHEAEKVTDVGGVHGLVYEEGIWTPTVAGATTAGNHTYTTQSGRYTRIGKTVHVQFDVLINVKDTSMAGNIRIAGLPFVHLNSSGANGALFGDITLNSGRTGVIYGFVSGLAILAVNQIGSDLTIGALSSTAIKNSSRLAGSLTYQIA